MTVAASVPLARTESAILLLFAVVVGFLGASVTTIVIVGAELEPVDADDESIELEPVTPTPDATTGSGAGSGSSGDGVGPTSSATATASTPGMAGGTPTASSAESPASGGAGGGASGGGGSGGSLATPTATPAGTRTPTPTPDATSGPGATATPGPTASPTSTASPTATPARTPSPTATGTPTATPTPDGSGDTQVSGNAARLSVSNAAPGASASDEVTVTNAGDRPGRLRIANVTASGDENGLTDAELAGGDDATRGELADVLRLRVAVVAPNGTEVGAYGTGDGARRLAALAASGPSDDLLVLDPGESVTLSLAWGIPSDAGNEIQSDTVEFATEVQLRATS